MSRRLQFVDRPDPGELPSDPREFLERLKGPSAIRVAGRDRSRTRAVSTLLHGNEPSGFRAIHRWLLEGHVPAVDSLLIVASVEVALTPPGFAYRMLPGCEDLNRCFLGPFQSEEGELAKEILDALRAATAEAVIDIHNNTGHNPPYGVGVSAGREALELTGLFGRRFVWSKLRLGSLMEAIAEIPSVTIEAGRSGDPRADEVAYRGLLRFLGEPRVIDVDSAPAVQILDRPMRVCLRAGAAIKIASSPQTGADLTIRTDLDRHNFEKLQVGTPIGWTHCDTLPLELIDEEGRDEAGAYFRIEGGEVHTRRPMIPIMITMDPSAASLDCLFYIVNEYEGEAPRSP